MDLEERVENELVLLPQPPRVLQFQIPSINFIYGHGKTIQLLVRLNLRGFVILKHTSAASRENLPVAESAKLSHGCIYIPSANFNRLLIFKNISNISGDEARTQIAYSCIDHLHILNDTIRKILEADVQLIGEKLNVLVIFSMTAKIKKDYCIEKLENDINNYLKVSPTNFPKANFPNLSLKFLFIDENSIEKTVLSSIKESCRRSILMKKLVLFFSNQLNQEQFYHISKQSFRILNRDLSSAEQINSLSELIDFYFPTRRQNLVSIPHFNNLGDNMLYEHTAEGEPKEFCTYASYFGEVRLFSEKLLKNLEDPCGILIKGVSSEHLKTILSCEVFQPQQFEIDWLYLGSRRIVAFEVGMAENKANPRSAIRNKITQCLTKIIPQMHLILYSIYISYTQNSGTNLANFWNTVQDILSFVIFIPGLQFELFRQQVIEIKYAFDTFINCNNLSKKNSQDKNFLYIIHQNQQQLINHLLFLVESGDKTNSLKLVRINCNFSVVDSYCSIIDLFRKCDFEENSFLNYASALLTISALNSTGQQSNKKVLDVDERYLNSLSRTKFSNTDSNIVLSPQQHQLLSEESKTHLIITGQPGTGKTTLLMAKCQQLAQHNDVHEILFLYGGEKRLFKKYLDRILQHNCSIELKNKFRANEITKSEANLESILSGQTDKVISLHIQSVIQACIK